ncbi:MAG: energy transducer TonB [Bryobacteraceae bacterium]|jgi:TonB family protein
MKAVALYVSLAALMLLTPMARPQQKDDSEERVYELNDDIKPPRITHQVNPDYSSIRGIRVKGSVEVALVVSSQGAPKDPRVVQSLDPEVDRCAVDAIRKWRFAPAQKDGKPVAVKLTIEMQFHSM